MKDDFILIIFEALFYGFCFTTVIIYSLHLIKIKRIKINLRDFFSESIKVIRIISILYFLYLFYHFLTYFNYATVENRATGPYAFAYWLMLLRPYVLVLLIQLFWIRKFNKKGFLQFILVALLFLTLIFSSSNFERFVIVVTSIHRDYMPNNLDLEHIEYKVPLLFLVIIIERMILFSMVVFNLLFFKKKKK
jgi:hypothetical protein